jgi:hypothetical protein
MDGPTTGSGLAGQINCNLQTSPGSNPGSNPADPWRLKYNACTAAAKTWAIQGFDPDPKQPDCPIADVSCKVQRSAQDAAASGVRSGVQGLVDLSVQAMVYLLSKVAVGVFKVTSISSPDAAFYNVYNQLAGVMVLLVVIFFLISTIINGLRTSAGPSPIATLGGLVRAIVGITLAGGIAYTIVAAWDQATNAVITQNANTSWDPGAITRALTNLAGGDGAVGTMLIALLLSLLGAGGLLLLAVMMLFRGVLTAGAAFFGAVAMTGQTSAETRHWGRRWFWTINALASSKFFIAELWIYASRSAYSSDDLMTVVRSVLLIWLMVVAPWILLRLTSLWDGYLSDVNAYGLLSSGGTPGEIGSAAADGWRQGADSAARASAGGGGGGGSEAADMADAGTAEAPATPGSAAEDVTGLDDEGTGAQAADAASTGGDGDKVGTPTGETDGDGSGDDAQPGPEGQPNAAEADAVQAGDTSAQHDVSAGTLTAPGQDPGQGADLPLTPQAAAGSDPTGTATTGSGSAGSPQDSSSSGAGAGADDSARGSDAPATGTSGSGGAAAAAEIPPVV